MKEYAQTVSRRALIVRLILVALSIGVFAAPNTLAGPGTENPRACAGVGKRHDFTSRNWLAESFVRRALKSATGGTNASPATSASAAATRTPAQSCAPHLYCLFAGCWYELLDNDTFDDASCSPDWVFPAGYTLTSSTVCNGMPYPVYSNVAVLPTASGFYQDFSVPADVDTSRPLAVSITWANAGRIPTSSSDRIVLELRENGLLVEQRSISTYLGPFDCHREDLTFSNSYVGRNLRLRVRSVHVTPLTRYYIDSLSVTSRR